MGRPASSAEASLARKDASPGLGLPSYRPASRPASAAAPPSDRHLEAPRQSSAQPQRSASPIQRGESVSFTLGEKLKLLPSNEAANLHLDKDFRGQKSVVGTVWGTARRPPASLFSLGSGQPFLPQHVHHGPPKIAEVQSRWAAHLLHHTIVPALPLSSDEG